MADVARLAGVSHQTVSRVVNGQTQPAPGDPRAGAGGDPPARLPAQHRGPRAGDPALGDHRGDRLQERASGDRARCTAPIQAAGREAGYFVSSANLQSLTREELVDAISHLRDQSVEAIVLIGGTDDALEVARAQEDLGTPVIVVEGDEAKTRWTVGVDQAAGAALGTAPPDRARAHRRSCTSADRRPGPRRAPGWRAGSRRCTPPDCGPRSTSRATGRPAAATRPAWRSPAATT